MVTIIFRDSTIGNQACADCGEQHNSGHGLNLPLVQIKRAHLLVSRGIGTGMPGFPEESGIRIWADIRGTQIEWG
jgi:hypothetical protein